MELTSLSTKGQVVLPKKIREAINLKPGVKLVVSLEGNRIVLTPFNNDDLAEDLFGAYKDLDLLGDLLKEHRNEQRQDHD